MSDNTSTRQIFFSGRVQGVGFRWTTNRIAADYPVTGFVRNLPDGRVELVAQGPAESVDEFLAAVRTHFDGNINSVETEDLTSPETYSQFETRRV